ncbi:MAG: YiiX/YebB-like N1pC/P60 family cysteine hydrolase [Bdellovibrionota bacterium]
MMILAGLALGLLFGTIFESVGHKFFGHPSRWQLQIYFRYPRVFDPFLRAHYHHFVIHHEKTYQTHMFRQFDSEEHKAEVDSWIARTFPADFAELVWRERYNLTLVGVRGTLPFALPFCTGTLLIWALLGPVAAVASLFTAFTPVLMSKFIHPAVHDPRDFAKAGPVARRIIASRYMRRIIANHFLHHRHLDTNFNLLLGGDHLVGLYKHPSPGEKTELAALFGEFDELRGVPAAAVKPRRGWAWIGVAIFIAALLPTSVSAAALSRDDVTRGERDYVNLGHPTNEQRFEFQRWHAGVFAAAEANSWNDLLSARAEGRIDYGLDPDAYNITFSEWSKRPEFGAAAYKFSGDGVLFRGQQLEPGDVLLTNLNSDSDGVYNTLVEGRTSFSHVAVFVMLNGIPAVVEIHDEGVRAVPLKFFLSDRFSTYVEVFRYRDITPQVRSRLSRAALDMIHENHGFDFFIDESQTTYLTCTLTSADLFRRSGLEPIRGETVYSQKNLPNLRILGVERTSKHKLLIPDDFTRSPRLQLIGVIDNDRFDRVVARALVRDRVQDLWQTQVLDETRFPFDYHIYRIAVDSIQNHSWVSPVLLKFLGFRSDNFPSGPPVFLSLTKPALERMEAASREVNKKLPRGEMIHFSTWDEAEQNPAVKALVLNATKEFAAMFRERTLNGAVAGTGPNSPSVDSAARAYR